MELRNSIVPLTITVKEDVTIPPYNSDDVTLLFAGVDRLVRFVIKHSDPQSV